MVLLYNKCDILNITARHGLYIRMYLYMYVQVSVILRFLQ